MTRINFFSSLINRAFLSNSKMTFLKNKKVNTIRKTKNAKYFAAAPHRSISCSPHYALTKRHRESVYRFKNVYVIIIIKSLDIEIAKYLKSYIFFSQYTSHFEDMFGKSCLPSPFFFTLPRIFFFSLSLF